MIARKTVIEGIVQGVGFRWATRDEAARLGIAGWVRNRADGTVEALVEASDEDHAMLRYRLEQGPRLSRVTAVDVTDELEERVAPGFEIRRDGS